MINWNGHNPENTAIHCPTKKLAKQVLKIAKNAGLTWRTGRNLENENHWREDKEETCYTLRTAGVGHCYRNFYTANGYAILNADPFVNWNISLLHAVPEDTSVEIGTGDDPVNHPSHYTTGKVECIDALEAATVNLAGLEAVCTANAIKYLWRWKQKNGKQDLEKAKWYIQKLIEL